MLQNEINQENWFGKGSTSRSSTRRSSTSSRSTPAPARPAVNVRYTHSPALTTRINREMIGNLRDNLRQSGQLNALTEEQLQRLQAQDLITQVRQGLRQGGYRPDSLATGMALWLTVNYAVANRLDLATLEAHELVRQLETGMAGDEQFAAMSQEDKQRMVETLYFVGVLHWALYHQAAQSGTPQQVQQMVRQSRQLVGAQPLRHRGNQLSLGG